MKKITRIYLLIGFALSCFVFISLYYFKQLNTYNLFSFRVEKDYNLLSELNNLEKVVLDNERISREIIFRKDSNFYTQPFKTHNKIIHSFQTLDTLFEFHPEKKGKLDTLKALILKSMEILDEEFRYDLSQEVLIQSIDKENYYLKKSQEAITVLIDEINVDLALHHISKKKSEKNRRITEVYLTGSVFLFFLFSAYYIIKFLKENMRFQHELSNKNYDLKILNKEITDLYFANAHNLQEPMRKIQMNIDLSNQHKQDLQHTFEKIKTISASQQEINQNILDYYEILSSNTKFEPVRLNQYFSDFLQETQYEQQLIVKIKELPEINADVYQLHHLFKEIFNNTIDFNKNQYDLKITIEEIFFPEEVLVSKYNIRRNMKYSVLSVRDNGAGVDPRYYFKIFDLFQKIDSSGLHKDKKGMGLSFCKRIMLNHKGFIFAENNKNGKGFNLLLFFPKIKM